MLLLLFGTTYQQIGERHDRRLAPQLGRSIEVAGRTPVSNISPGRNRNPDLAWSDVPQSTKSFVLICRDPDVPSRILADPVKMSEKLRLQRGCQLP